MRKFDADITEYILVVAVTVALIFQTWAPAIVAIAAILNYAFEQWWLNKNDGVKSQDDRIGELDKRFNSLVQEYRNLQFDHVEIKKQSEDVKKIVQQHNLKQMFGPKV